MTQAKTATAKMIDRLKTIGLGDEDAELIEQTYSKEPDFFKGLDTVARVYLDNQIPSKTPTPAGEPWATLFQYVQLNGSAPARGLEEALNLLDPYLYLPITSLITLRAGSVSGTRARSGKGKKAPTSDQYIAALSGLGYKFALNLCNDDLEVNGEKINDAQAAQIRTAMRDLGYTRTTYFEDAYITEAAANAYHPVQNYLTSLQYDGGDHIRQLASYFVDGFGSFERWLRKWLIGAVAKVYEGEQNPMLVLDGAQGIGKSEFARWLCSSMPDYFIEGRIDPDDKDSFVRLASKWVWEVSELGSTTRKADREALKAFISTRRVTVRKAYARYDIDKPAMASLIGTINNEIGFLYDPTGHRRFLTVNVKEIDWQGYIANVNVNDVWAEAHAAYQAGEPWQLEPVERAMSESINKTYEVEDPYETPLLEEFEITNNPVDWVSTGRIVQTLQAHGIRGNTRAVSMYASSTLRRLGLNKARGHNKHGAQVWGYEGIREILQPPIP